VGYKALAVVDAPPDVAVDVSRRGGIDGHRCPVLEAGHNLCAEAGLLANVPAAATRHLDQILVTEDWARSALLATDNGWVEMPAARIVEQVGDARGAPARPSVAHLDIRRIEPRVRVGITEDLRLAQTRLAAGTESVLPVGGARLVYHHRRDRGVFRGRVVRRR